jgi:hypothetical protein
VGGSALPPSLGHTLGHAAPARPLLTLPRNALKNPPDPPGLWLVAAILWTVACVYGLFGWGIAVRGEDEGLDASRLAQHRGLLLAARVRDPAR